MTGNSITTQVGEEKKEKRTITEIPCKVIGEKVLFEPDVRLTYTYWWKEVKTGWGLVEWELAEMIKWKWWEHIMWLLICLPLLVVCRAGTKFICLKPSVKSIRFPKQGGILIHFKSNSKVYRDIVTAKMLQEEEEFPHISDEDLKEWVNS